MFHASIRVDQSRAGSRASPTPIWQVVAGRKLFGRSRRSSLASTSLCTPSFGKLVRDHADVDNVHPRAGSVVAYTRPFQFKAAHRGSKAIHPNSVVTCLAR